MLLSKAELDTIADSIVQSCAPYLGDVDKLKHEITCAAVLAQRRLYQKLKERSDVTSAKAALDELASELMRDAMLGTGSDSQLGKR